ncbi:hypothetical protein CKC_03370 [Candidatus Liberibacter solanacearum CLso-ZC1]|uniref:Uncharacterized protein n=1 Tax=Liberibacter solanacearum (strain CLso-ZC1) TaxID=658172 RepID=E4UB32_LIBSC|nr:hypothetical protein [Candidatus Liberibacter solanacearum]ADR52423.1 hypothetical protein CKC_03370 [Candidatus Liberibacter solanacearum CLso-ZC1]
MIKKVEKSDGIKKDHAVDLAVRAQREKAIGLNNFLAEARVLVNKLPKDDSVRSQCETRNNLVRSELGVINNKVRQYDNELRNRIGRDYSNDGSLFFRSFPTVEGSGWLLSPTSYFLSFAG